jgi:hypothetical protein
MTYDETPQQARLREKAVRRLKKRRDFKAHLLIYVLVNTFLVVIWAMTSYGGFFWPIFPILGWGIGVLANAYDAYIGDEITEEQIQREIRHLEHRP